MGSCGGGIDAKLIGTNNIPSGDGKWFSRGHLGQLWGREEEREKIIVLVGIRLWTHSNEEKKKKNISALNDGFGGRGWGLLFGES